MAILSSARRGPITAILYLKSPLQKERLLITILQMSHISPIHVPLKVILESKVVLTNITFHPEYTYTERTRHTESNPRKGLLIMFWQEMPKSKVRYSHMGLLKYSDTFRYYQKSVRLIPVTEV